MNWLAIISGVLTLLNWLIGKAHDAGQIDIGKKATLDALTNEMDARLAGANASDDGLPDPHDHANDP